MNLADVENLSAAELKEQRDSIVAELSGAEGIDREEIARRYVQARFDAKFRDEKLSEQGVTINSLNDSIGLHQREIARLEGELNQCKSERTEFGAIAEHRLAEQIDAYRVLHEQAAALTVQRDEAKARADRLKSEAERHATAFNSAQKALADAAALNQIEAADKGS